MNERPLLPRPSFDLESFFNKRQRVLQSSFIVPMNLTNCFASRHGITKLFFHIKSDGRVNRIVDFVSARAKRVRRKAQQLSITSSDEAFGSGSKRFNML